MQEKSVLCIRNRAVLIFDLQQNTVEVSQSFLRSFAKCKIAKGVRKRRSDCGKRKRCLRVELPVRCDLRSTPPPLSHKRSKRTMCSTRNAEGGPRRVRNAGPHLRGERRGNRNLDPLALAERARVYERLSTLNSHGQMCVLFVVLVH